MKVKVNQVTRYHFLFIPSSWWSRSLLKILKITTHTSTLSFSTVNYRLERIESEDVTDSREQFLFITWNLSHRAPFTVHVRDIWSKMIFKKKWASISHRSRSVIKIIFIAPTLLGDFLSLIFTAISQIDLCNEEFSFVHFTLFLIDRKDESWGIKKVFFYYYFFI